MAALSSKIEEGENLETRNPYCRNLIVRRRRLGSACYRNWRRVEWRELYQRPGRRSRFLVSIFGTNLASTTASASSVPLSTSLGGVSVTFNNIAAPLGISYRTACSGNGDQINAQVPYELAGSSSAQVVVNKWSRFRAADRCIGCGRARHFHLPRQRTGRSLRQ